MTTTVEPTRLEQTRARYPDEEGFVERDGVRSSGSATATASRRSCSCRRGRSSIRAPGRRRSHTSRGIAGFVTFDGRGNGRSDRPREPDAYREEEFAADALAVLDATRHGAGGARVPLARRRAGAAARRRAPRARRRAWCSSRRRCRCRRRRRARAPSASSSSRATTYDGWEKWNSHYWLAHYEDFLEFFFSQVFNEPHSTKQREDAVGWALETNPETLVATQARAAAARRGERAGAGRRRSVARRS